MSTFILKQFALLSWCKEWISDMLTKFIPTKYLQLKAWEGNKIFAAQLFFHIT